ncbi:MAG TPA: hypothetical protein VGG68_02630 [Caulobacteraceae bacterium]|jgi:hypothetical protein
MIRAFLGLLVLAAWMVAAPAAASPDLFADGAPPLHLTITAPFGALASKAKYSLDPYPATLAVTDAAGASLSFDIHVRPRGISRRKMYCAFPPLFLLFDKTAMHGSLFHAQNELKLVTYCSPPADYEQRIMLEYLVYKLYNLITPMSFRVRPAEVTYRNGPTDRGVTRFGYLIEDVHNVAARNDRKEVKGPSHVVSLAQLDAHATTRVTLLEFMIGNLDWEPLASAAGEKCCHNIRLLAQPEATPATASMVTPVPYDFDSTGWVDPPYARPPEGVPIDSLTQRYYRGFCAQNGEISAVAQEYRARRADMRALIDNQPGLTAAFREKTDRYLDGFFAVLDDPTKLQTQVLRHCR